MVKKREAFPSDGDLVICTVVKVFGHGAFAKLDEYEGKEGFIHVSEVASIWVKNIRDYVREGQKVIAKVLSVDKDKGHIDLSVRRVGDAQRTNKNQEWKRAQKAEKLLELAAEGLGKSLEEAYEEVGFVLEDKYGEIYTGLEEILIEGEKALEGVPKEWWPGLQKIAEENIVLPHVEIDGFLELSSKAPDGVLIIKEALKEAVQSQTSKEIGLDIRHLSPPIYRIHVTAPDYKSAEEAMKSSAEKAISFITGRGGEGRFIREWKQSAS